MLEPLFNGSFCRPWRRQIVFVVALCFVVMSSAMAAADGADSVRFFREKIEPVLKAQCFSCHSRQAEEVKGGLRLDFKAGVLRGGDSGPAVVAGKSGESLLLQAIRHEGGMAMPPKKPKLSEKTIADFVKWVEMGAPDPRDREPSDAEDSKFEEARRHWAFQPLRRRADGRQPSDDLRRSKNVRGLTPAGSPEIIREADKRTLIRRVTFDLIGLPPTLDEAEAFVGDESADAYEKLVDRLLGSRHFGEKAAQQWLDVVRFAETEGYEYGSLANDLAQSFAKRLKRECGNDREKIIDRAFRLALGRVPTAIERERSLVFLHEQPLSEFALAMFNLNEFVYVP